MTVEYRLVQARCLGYRHFKTEPHFTLLSLTFEKVIPKFKLSIFLSFFWPNSPTPQWARASSFEMFLDHTQRRTTARRRDLYLTTHNIHNRQTSIPRVVFEPTISAG